MRILILTLLLPTILLAQDFVFQQEVDTIPLEIDGWFPYQPWAGGDDEICPSFCDIDADGDLDLFVGNYSGKISCFENQGNTTIADYRLITREYAEVNLYGEPYYGRTDPQFCDIDADGDLDLFSGDLAGLVHFWENIGSAQQAEYQLVTDSLANIDTPGTSRPTFCDIDADGDLDLFVGYWWGSIYFYRNDGTPQACDYNFVTNWFDSISVDWHANPVFCDIDADNDYDLFIGDEYGRISFYRNDGDSVQWDFTLVTEEFLGLDVGRLAAPEFADIDSDGDYDFFCGQQEAAIPEETPREIYFYENIGDSVNWQFEYVTHSYTQFDKQSQGALQLVDIDNDHDMDLFGTSGSHIVWMENVGDEDDPHFYLQPVEFQNITLTDILFFFGDLDADGDYDMVASGSQIPSTSIQLFKNIGTPQEPNLILITEEFVTGDFNHLVAPTLADIDSDGDLDMFISDPGCLYYFYENIGTPLVPNYIFRENNWQGIGSCNAVRSSQFVDLDGDADLDLLIDNNTYSGVAFYRNIGTPNIPNMELITENFVIPDIGGQNFLHVSPYAVDIDNDDDLDLFTCIGDDGILFFRNLGDTSAVGPRTRFHNYAVMDFSIGPNPANPITWISYNLPYPQKAEIAVYNLLGQKVATLASGLQMPGEHRVLWNAEGVSSGVYWVWLNMSGSGATPTMEFKVEKVVVVE